MGWQNFGTNARTIGSLCGILVFLGTAASFIFDVIPYAKSADLAAVKREVGQQGDTLKAIQISVLRNEELARMNMLAALLDKMTQLPADSREYREVRSQRVSAEQQLGLVRDELATVKGRQLQ